MSESEPKPKVVVVMPAYNAAETLARTYQEMPRDAFDEVVLVEDASQDQTAAPAESLGMAVLEHPENRGYGANQKTCYRFAPDGGADIVVMLHPDYQYDPKILSSITAPILQREVDVVLASRMLGDPLQNGMPLYKYLSTGFSLGSRTEPWVRASRNSTPAIGRTRGGRWRRSLSN